MVHMCFYFSYESGCFTNFINDDFPPYPQYKSSSLKTLSKTLKISTLVHFVIDILFDTCLSIPYLEHYVKSSLFQSCTFIKWLCQVPFDNVYLSSYLKQLVSRAACCLPCSLITPTNDLEEETLSKTALCQVRPLFTLTHL